MSLESRTFKKGDKVTHLVYGRGIIVQDISNQYAEVYAVKITENFTSNIGANKDSIVSCSEDLLQHDMKK